ncbi:telomere-associated protein RIF1 isoform X2 [Aedes aegypti]|nr:telomere-associated protein RIF1 isoform X2 [Aedes aegypti]XP_021709371.1 telomere-associated protein RIF1 isoform X2 [Aedes aegypti]
MTANSGIKLPGYDQYEKLRKALQSGGRSQIEKILESLVKACQTKRDYVGEKQKLDDDQMNFWFNDVLRLLFDWENPVTRELALRASEAILPHLEQTLYLDSPAWPALKTQISNVYSNLLEQARGRNDPEWHRKWSVLVRILDKEICQGAVIINVFLAIVESGFRSAELLVREQSFDCWQLLVEIFAKYNQIHIQKRIKLICIPLKSSKSKTEVIAKKKFEIWWFLINKLQPQLDAFADNVFEPFIYFCFGPSFKTPLCYYFDNSYQEFGAPGKIYNSIKQLSAAALIHMLGPAGRVTDTLIQDVCESNSGKNGAISFTAGLNGEKTIISPKLFSLKAKLIINSCTECTVLFSQMKDKDYMELNRCLWKNLLARVEQEQAISRVEMFSWIRENLNALISLSTKLQDEAIKELIYDIVQMVAETNLLSVTIGQDSPEQLTINYRNFMTLMFNPALDFPAGTSFTILSHAFDLRRYSSQRGGYWDMLQKTVQYLTTLEPSLLQNGDPKSAANRRMVTQIYRSMALHLTEQIDSHREQFEHSQSIVFGFLLFPLEYDRFLEVGDVRDVWEDVFNGMVTGQKSTRYACGLSEVIKAMTVAKYNCNLGVILRFFRVVLESVPGDFDLGQPPVKTLELFKDLVRKALVFQNSLAEVDTGVASFRKLIERLTNKALFAVIMPIRNIINELIDGDNDTLKEEVTRTMKTLIDRFVMGRFIAELKSQPKEVKWNCKMLIDQLMKQQWKVGELKNLVNICEGKDPNKLPKPVKKEGEFVVIEKVWKFTPDKLTEHQRERLSKKRDDIPALYNDLSQSQDNYVIKPWTPNKIVIPSDQGQDHDTIVMCASADSGSIPNGEVPEASVPKEQGAGVATENKLDKENNNGNVLDSTEKDESASSSSVASKKPAEKRSRVIRELDQLKIDTVEGKNLQVGRLPRTRRAGSLEPVAAPNGRRKSLEPKKLAEKNKRTDSENRRTRRSAATKSTQKKETKEESLLSPARKKSEDKSKSADRSSPRKALNFDNVIDKQPATATEAPASPVKAKNANDSVDEIVESSQAGSQSLLSRKFTPRKPKEDEKQESPKIGTETLPFDTEAEKELAKLSGRKSPMKAKNESPLKSPGKITRATMAAGQQQQNPADVETEPNTESPLKSPAKVTRAAVAAQQQQIIPDVETEPNTEPPVANSESTAPSETPAVTQIELRSRVASPVKSPASAKGVASPAKAVQSPAKRVASPAKRIASPAKSPAKSPKKGKRSISPAPEPMETESAPESPKKSENPSEDPNQSPNLSPVRNLDEDMEPLTKSLNRSLVSSPDGADQEAREADLLNSTLNISPISEEKAHPSTPSIPMAPKISPASGSGEKRTSSRIMEREKGPMVSPITRRTRNSPPVLPAAVANLRNRTPQSTPRSPKTGMIELRGRGAQLINLIRSQQNEMSPKPAALPPPQQSSTPKPVSNMPSDRSLMLRKLATAATATNATTTAPAVQSPELSKPLPPVEKEKEKDNDYLVFSKVLPSPQASPAASILKRKHNQDDSGDDLESPANKRKRVSFHDPPVSLTKQYIRQEEECRSPSISRCILMAGMSPTDKAKFLLRRKSKADSMSELAKFTRGSSTNPDEPGKDEDDEISSSPDSLDGEFMLNTTDNMSTLQVTTGVDDVEMKEDPKLPEAPIEAEPLPEEPVPEADEPVELPKRTSPRKISPKPASEDPAPPSKSSPTITSVPIPPTTPVPEKPDTSIRFQTEEEILAHVISKYSLDAILERCLSAGKILEQQKSARLLTRELSTLMSKNSKMRHTVLDELSERHSAEFLDHAVQENSSAMVCERLSMTTMTEFIFERLRKMPPEGGSQEDQDERLKILQIMFDNLAQMHTSVGGVEFGRMKDRFVKAAVFAKSRNEVMALLEEYFRQSSMGLAAAIT